MCAIGASKDRSFVSSGSADVGGLTRLEYNKSTMWGWVVQNKEWVFSGAGIAALGVVWWLVKKFWPKREVVATPAVVQAPSTNIAPSIVMSPTINFPVERAPEPLKQITPSIAAAKPKPKPILSIEATKIAKIAIQGDIWTLKPNVGRWEPPKRYRALLADISNVPTDEAHTARAKIRAGIRMDYGGRPRTYSPLPWLEEYTNTVYLEPGARKTVVLCVGEDSRTGQWTFVLHQRKEYYTSNTVSEMDWTNACPIPSDLPFEILMIDMDTGALLTKFVYLWTFDAENNWPILKLID
jgi:hypothetical protein